MSPGLIRVLTYNLRDLKDDPRAIARVVRAVRPDVACFQEVPRHAFAGHRIGELADACGLVWPGGAGRSGGTAILTSMRVSQVAGHAARLPVRGRFTRTRGYAAAVVSLPGGPTLTVASIHLSLDPAERLEHAQAVLDRIRRFGPAPYVIAGDLNESPGSPVWRLLGRELTEAAGGGPTYPARAPRRRIDAVFVSAGVVVRSVRVVGPADGVDPADLLAASDHLPVVADLELVMGHRADN